MSTLAEIEAALPSLSAEELARVESKLRELRRHRGLDPAEEEDVRMDGLLWPKTSEETQELLTDLDKLSPLLTAEEADRFDSWRVFTARLGQAFHEFLDLF